MNKFKLSKLNIIQLILVILVSFICFFLIFICFHDPMIYYNFLLFILSILIYIVPMITIMLIFKNTLKHKINDKKGLIITILIIPIIIIYVLITTLIISMVSYTKPVHNYKAYYKLYSKRDVLINKFPKKIPKNATNIEFYYTSGPLQANTEMNLSFKTNNETINKYIKRYEKEAIWMGKSSEDVNDELNDIFYSNYNINEDYIIYHLVTYCSNSNTRCNHGKYSIVAINKKENKCIFNYNYW